MTLNNRYDHTQVGWVVLGTLLFPAALLLPLSGLPGTRQLLIGLLASMVLLVLLFGSLRVSVDVNIVAWRFGIGLLGGRIDLAEVHSFRQVQNPWHWGWGLRRYPGGKLYNVSGLLAVELVLRNGERLRLGTDEPLALLSALRAKLCEPVPYSDWPKTTRPNRLRTVLVLVTVLMLLPVGLFWLMTVQARPPVVTVSRNALAIDSLFYGQTYSASEIKSVRLVPQLPRIRLRTNGYAANGALRGWFLLDELGKGKLFVQLRQPPFILVNLKDGFVVVNCEEPAATLRLFSEIGKAMPELVQE